ncbi:hypothetical protein [Actinomadura chibensis]|uniref:ParA family protein n=1 Tax=Actinomadura chibensis TaxID=392828 RepID=A0A5D0NHJ2_9ACTN|nr:hypothetical protein [Actinomadura chibensis]TYB43870.1 hypothetical protein FXF69_23140 [Actinomadura chibensis]
MALYCLVSAGGSPGVTTTALGLALAWPGKVLLAECDPMGRRVLPGYMADRLEGSAGPGLLGLATSARAEPEGSLSLEDYVFPIADDGPVGLLHGVRDPRNASQLVALWPLLVQALTARDGDAIADLGRVGGAETPVPLLAAADVVVVVLKPTLVQVDAVRPRLDVVRALVADQALVGLCVVEDGPYRTVEMERALKVPVLAELPHSTSDARVLSDGARPRRTFRTCLLMRSLTRLATRLREVVGPPPALSSTADGPSNPVGQTLAGEPICPEPTRSRS